jgi:hypothetical protein
LRPLVLFSLSNGWGIRNFVHTGLLKRVSEFADIAVATSPSQLSFFENMLEQRLIHFLILIPENESYFWMLIRRSKKAILQAKHQISTAIIKSGARSNTKIERYARYLAWKLFGLVACTWQIRLIEAFERSFKRSTIQDLGRLPDVLVNGEPFDNRDIELQRTMKRLGVPTIAIIPSWDNPSTKGCILTDADRILVWGPYQMREILNYYPHIPKKSIIVSGIPQFDSYSSDTNSRISRDSFFNELNIPLSKRVILHATSSERLFPSEPAIVATVVTAILSGQLPPNLHVLIRCHPADRADRYQHFLSSGCVSIFPSSRDKSIDLSEWIPPVEEVDLLCACLKHTEVCINAASTMTLDALACGRPVINIGFDGEDLGYFKSTARYYDYSHLAQIAKSGAVPIVRSAEQLLAEISNALGSPEQRQQQRAFVVNDFCPRPSQGSVSAIVDTIKSFCAVDRSLV